MTRITDSRAAELQALCDAWNNGMATDEECGASIAAEHKLKFCAASVIRDLLADRADSAAEIERLRAGLIAIVNCQSPLTRAQMQEAAADILNGRVGHWPDQSPFVARVDKLTKDAAKLLEQAAQLKAAREIADALLAECKVALEPFAKEAAEWDDREIDDEDVISFSGCASPTQKDAGKLTVGDLRRARAALGAYRKDTP